MSDKGYWFLHRNRKVFVRANTVSKAMQKFQERFGYWPTQENQENDEAFRNQG